MITSEQALTRIAGLSADEVRQLVEQRILGQDTTPVCGGHADEPSEDLVVQLLRSDQLPPEIHTAVLDGCRTVYGRLLEHFAACARDAEDLDVTRAAIRLCRVVDIAAVAELQPHANSFLNLAMAAPEMPPGILPAAVRASMAYRVDPSDVVLWERLLDQAEVAAYAFNALLEIDPHAKRVEDALTVLWKRQLCEDWKVDTAFLLRRGARAQGSEALIRRVLRRVGKELSKLPKGEQLRSRLAGELERRDWSRAWTRFAREPGLSSRLGVLLNRLHKGSAARVSQVNYRRVLRWIAIGCALLAAVSLVAALVVGIVAGLARLGDHPGTQATPTQPELAPLAGLAALCAIFLITVLASLALTPLACRWAPRLGLVDRPDGQRRLRGNPIPLGGGVAVFAATALVVGGLLVVPNPWRQEFQQAGLELLILMALSGAIVGLGLLNDRVPIRGRHMLLGQVCIGCGLLAAGVWIESVEVFGVSIHFGLFAAPVTLLWLLLAINSVNLLDGIDGLATTVGIILSGTLSLMAAMNGDLGVALLGLVFVGSLLGFLLFNFPPARIFLGDSGSMLIGLVLGVMAIQASLKGPGTVLLAAPLAVWTLPFFDSAMAIVRRKLTGRSIYTSDRSHVHHRLLGLLGSKPKVVMVVSAVCVLTSAAGLASVALKSDIIAVVTCAGVIAVFVATGILGRSELLLLAIRVRDLAASFARPLDENRRKVSQSTVRLHGRGEWDSLWTTLVESADRRLNLDELHLDLNLPWMHEAYNATWERSSTEDPDRSWMLDYAILISGQPVGRLVVRGRCVGGLTMVSDSREQDEDQIRSIAELISSVRTFLQGQMPPVSDEASLEVTEPGQVFRPSRDIPGKAGRR